MLFTEIYRPKSLSQIIGQREAVRKLLIAIKNKRPVLIYGPVGTGKTSSVHAIANDFNFELIELNASDLRTKEQINLIVKRALEQQSLFAKEKIILIDELEGISGTRDRGCINALNTLLTIKSPLILITSDPYEPKLKEIRKKVEIIKFEKLLPEDIVRILQEICKKEKIDIQQQDLKKLALMADGDARAAINDLQAFAGDIKGLGQREKEISIFNALKVIFKSNTFSVLNAFENVDMEPQDIILWIDENLPLEYKNEELTKAYDYLSKADIFRNRIIKRQYWRYLAYVNALITAGIALAKNEQKEKFVNYKPITRLLKIWIANRNEKKIIAQAFAKATHCSMKKALREMPYFEIILNNNPFIEKELNLDENNY
ncbi:MAG: replication factor C large subunit [Candidatus Pacearchaeota archaeon]